MSLSQGRSEVRAQDVAELLDISLQRAHAVIEELTDEGVFVKHGND